MPGQPDLTVQSIGAPNVQCPGGAGTCVTTVDVTIENVGTGAAGAFSFETTFDPSQMVVVNQVVPSGLPAGMSQSFTIMTLPGGNCFDPDCTITVVIDGNNDVAESDETNNTATSTTPG